MDRKEFIKNCGYSCLGLMGLSLLDSCTSVKYVQTGSENNQLKIARSEFIEVKKNKTQTRRYVIVKANALNFPIVLYRFTDTDFSALLLQCPHQGMELNVNGDLLSCSAHGSEFNNKGELIQGPAEQGLKKYKVTSDTQNIYIHLT
ncbi:MAG: Rieske (2Fe-2S) protein [Bacteroidia bacterium]